MKALELAEFINRREAIRINKEDLELSPPWIKDPILEKYRFCNVRREDDRVTRWLAANWRTPYAGHPNMTVAMLLARMINWPPTLAAIGFPKGKWCVDLEMEIIDKIHSLKGKVWSGAYIVSTCGARMDKAAYVVQTVCGPVAYHGIRPQAGDSLDSFWQRLKLIPGLGAGFIAAQVVADLKYVDEHLKEALDWWSWAVPGPGSRRGLARVYDFPLHYSWKRDEWKAYLAAMISVVQPFVLDIFGGEQLHAQDWQNCLCEFDKYERVRNGEGAPRSTYRPSTDY